VWICCKHAALLQAGNLFCAKKALKSEKNFSHILLIVIFTPKHCHQKNPLLGAVAPKITCSEVYEFSLSVVLVLVPAFNYFVRALS